MHRRVFTTSAFAVLLGAMLLIGSSPRSMADSINNTANAIHLLPGESKTIGYSVQATGPDGCDPESTPVTMELAGLPLGVTYAPTTLTFDSCNSVQNIIFTAAEDAAPTNNGPAKVTVVITGGDNGDYSLSPGNLNVFVKAPIPPADTTAPTVTGTPDREPNSNGWYNSAVTIIWTADEPATCDDPTVYSGPDGAAIVQMGECEDAAGNVGTGYVTINYDSTAPTITGEDVSYIIGQPSGSYAECDDATSGIASCDVPTIDTSSVGPGTVTVNAQDNAGNTNSLTLNYSVIYGCVDESGFKSPVPNTQYKIGRDVPLKFVACDFEGNSVSGVIAGAEYKLSTGTEWTEATTKSKATTDNLFRYDPSAGQYIFNMVTSGLQIQSYEIRAVLDSGQVISTTVTFTK